MAEITVTRPAIYECEGVRLMPGANTITDDELARLTRNSGVRDDINAGVLIVGHKSKSAKSEPKAEPAPEPEKEPEAVKVTKKKGK